MISSIYTNIYFQEEKLDISNIGVKLPFTRPIEKSNIQKWIESKGHDHQREDEDSTHSTAFRPFERRFTIGNGKEHSSVYC